MKLTTLLNDKLSRIKELNKPINSCHSPIRPEKVGIAILGNGTLTFT